MEDTTQLIGALIPTLLITLPQAIIWLVGIVVALTRMERHPRVSKLALAGCALNLFVAVVSVGTNALPVILMQQDGYSISQIGMIMGGVGVIGGALHTIASTLILVAVFAGRSALAAAHPTS